MLPKITIVQNNHCQGKCSANWPPRTGNITVEIAVTNNISAIILPRRSRSNKSRATEAAKMRVPLLILGGGPAGYAAAFRAADGGSPVTLVESEPKLGGTCLLHGCIPSKSLLHVARVIAEASEVEAAGIVFDSPRIDLNGLRSHQSKLIQKLSTGLDQLVRRRKVTRIHARGSFEDSETLRLEGEHESIPSDRILKFDRCIVATGSVSVPCR